MIEWIFFGGLGLGVLLRQVQLDRSYKAELKAIRELFGTIPPAVDLTGIPTAVAEQLHRSLDSRFTQAFEVVDRQLENVHQGLGEMRTIAGGVGDLKRVLTNIKIRGTWAEVQLGAILEQTLDASQFARNVKPKADSSEIVEYVVKLPGGDQEVWLPIDSKFPQEDYLRIQTAADKGDVEAVSKAADSLAVKIRKGAVDIQSKYISPPRTTDFAIMFLATEGLYMEVLRYPGLVDELQQRRIIVAGPVTLTAILGSIRLGFQTIAVQQRATEVWELLRLVKGEFVKFSEVLDKAKRQLATAGTTLEETGTRTRAMERALKAVEILPGSSL